MDMTLNRSYSRNTLILVLIGVVSFFVWLSITLQYSNPEKDTDFLQDYLAGKGVFQAHSIYGPFNPSQFNRADHEKAIWGFHPPTVAPFFVPFALLPFPVAFILFSVINFFLFILLLRSCRKNLYKGDLPEWVFGLFLLWYPFTFCIARGQLSVILAVLLLGVARALHLKRDTQAGFFLGIAIVLKIFPGICCLYLILTRRWVALFATGLTSVGFLILTIAVVGMSDVQLYFKEIATINIEWYSTHYINISLNNLIAPLFVLNTWVENLITWPLVARVFYLSVAVGIVCTLSWLTLKFEPPGTSFNWGVFYTYVTASTIVSPISWEHNFLIALPGFVFFFSRFSRFEQRLFGGIVLFLGLPLVNLIGPVIQFYAPLKVGVLGFLVTRLHTIGIGLVLLLYTRNLAVSD